MKSQISQAFKIVFIAVLMLYSGVISANGSTGSNTMQSVDYDSEFSIRRGETVQFSDGLKIKFLGHSHKTVMAGGPSSPLIVSVEYDLNGNKEFNTHNIYPEENETWGWEGRYFSLVAYEYGSTMKLKVSHSKTLRSVQYDKGFYIRRGETVQFADGFKLTFNSLAGGIMKLPLSINVTYEIDGEEESHISDIDPDEGSSWTSENHVFYISDYNNHSRIKLRVVDTSKQK